MLSRAIGDPARLILPEGATRQDIDALRHELGLTDPILEQYGRFLVNASQGDFGESTWTRLPVMELVIDAVPKTLLLAGITMLLAVVVSLSLAIWAATSKRVLVNRIIMSFSFASVSLPEFWFGLILISFLAVRLSLFPTSGYGTWQHMVLPVLTLMIRPVGRLAHTTRRALMEAMRQDYVLTAHAKGLSRRLVLRRHALRNSMLSVITLAGDELANLVAGAVVVETIFAWPGVGNLTIQAIQQRDPFLVVGIVVVVSALVLLLNLAADILYAFADPRVRMGWTVAEAS